MNAPYVTDEARGETWSLLLGDSCERMAEIPDESVDLSIYSPPFASLFTYSPSDRDLGNSASRAEFFEHYGFIIRENLRITKPGRECCVHVQQLTTTKASDGYVGLTDFRGDVIRAYQEAGWRWVGEVTVNKNPQAQAIRTKAQSLMFVTKNRDSAASRPALADYLLVFRKPGDNEVPIAQTDGHWTRVSNEEWIKLAEPVWWDITESDTLNVKVARDDADDRWPTRSGRGRRLGLQDLKGCQHQSRHRDEGGEGDLAKPGQTRGGPAHGTRRRHLSHR